MADEIRDASNVAPVQEVDNNLNTRRTSNKLDVIDRKMDNLYKNINISRTDNRNNLDSIIDDLDTALDRLQGSEISVSNMSELIRRLDKKTNSDTTEFMKGVTSLFEDDSIIGSLIANETIHQFISSENYTYDMLCKYMPRLQTALEIKRDNVLSSDNFSKEFINPTSYISVKRDAELFNINTKKLENEYNLSTFFEKTYMNVSKYGEDFIYIVPYGVAFERVIRRSRENRAGSRSPFTAFNMYGESAEYSESTVCLKEDFVDSKEFKEYINEISDVGWDKSIREVCSDDFSLDLHFNTTGMLHDRVRDMAFVQEQSQLDKFRSLSSLQERSAEAQMRKMTPENDGLTRAANGGVQDGLIVPGELSRDPDKIDNNFLGAVVERLPRENVVPIYIGNVCFGYYYFEFAEDPTACGFCGGHHMTPGLSNANALARSTSEEQEEMVIRYISARISNAIDTKFINSNKDLKEEIYAILRYNEKFDMSKANHLGVTFIPADDIVHCYFDIDEHTHRGISDLKNSIVTGMLYVLLYLTTLIGQVTRSTDKRVYYVKQNVETNVARTMMNVVKQIKKGGRKAYIAQRIQ